MIGEVVKQLVGLFVDDEFMAVGILVAVAVVALLTLLGVLPTGTAGLLLAVSLPSVLAASVMRSVQRARRTGPRG
jgi:CBS-domain-containing membrane protein